MVCAVATILAVRLFLELTGYPQIGDSTLHIAHAEWGGLAMTLAVLMQLIFLSKRTETVAAMLGGAGFGLFIDEVGKFVTQSNDYFFQPSVAIMYVTFVGLYLVVRYIFSSAGITEVEYLANAIRELGEGSGVGLEESERKEILYYLDRCDQRNPLVGDLRRLATDFYLSDEAATLGLYRRWKRGFFRRYRRLTRSRWFTPAITIFFIVELLGGISVMVSLMFNPAEISEQIQGFTFSDWAIVASNVVSALFIAWGVALLPRERLRAFLMFERSVLVAVFIGQLFLFYKDEFGALSGLLINLLIYVGLRFLIEQEKDAVIESAVAGAPA
jgi:hypothetical protein